MSHNEKSFWYNTLKEAGWVPEKHYREYNTEELVDEHKALVATGLAKPVDYEEPKPWESNEPQQEPKRESGVTPPPIVDENDGETYVEIDEQGRKWIQREIKKPAYPKPRGRRLLRYDDPGTVKKTFTAGEYTETVEVARDPQYSTPREVRITLPSYQAGIYRDPRFKQFKVITYNGEQGFDRLDVEKYYGGPELVPSVCKRKYVSNVLCYDMRSVIRAIQDEARELRLRGGATK